MTKRAIRASGVVASAALLLAACGGSSTSVATGAGDPASSTVASAATAATVPATVTTAAGAGAATVPGQTPASVPTSAAVKSDLPSVEVVDVSSGEKVNLTSLARDDKAILLWMWAPH